MRRCLTALVSTLSVVAAAQPASIPVVLVGPSQREGAAVDMNPSGLLLGGWSNRAWRSALSVTRPWPAHWQALTLGQAARRASLGTPEREGDGPCDEALFTSLTQPLQSVRAGEFQVLVPAGVRAQPRPVTLFPTSSATYRAIVQRELLKMGFKNPPVRINTIVRADLDGNGTQEVLIEASNIGTSRFYPDGPGGQGGQYSVVWLRTVQGRQASMRVLFRDIQVKDVPQAELGARGGRVMTRFGIAGVLDVNGDGRMEVVLASAYHEGLAGSVVAFTPDWTPEVVAESGCGA